MQPRLALATTNPEGMPCPDLDTGMLLDPLRAAGVDATLRVWHDPEVDWASYDLVVVRSVWDYHARLPQFLAWLDSLDPARVLNQPGLIRWNLDKTYLFDLAAHRVPVVPSTLCHDLDEVRAAVAALPDERIVIKPTVGAASEGVHLLQRDDARLPELAGGLFAAGRRVLVQPAIGELQTTGEHDLVFFDGRFSHAVAKGPMLAVGGGWRDESGYVEELVPATASIDEIRVAELATLAIAGIAQERGWSAPDPVPLYGRFDIVATPDRGCLLLEAELFEPQWFLRFNDGAEARVANAIIRRLQALR